MAQDPAAAMVASGRELIDRTLKAVEDVCLSGKRNLECLVVAVAANFAGSHLYFLRLFVVWQSRRGKLKYRIEV
jgi:hypothetical protein